MAIIGFILCFVIIAYCSLAWAGWCVICMTKYNMGGVPNTWTERFLCVLVGAFVFVCWHLLIDNTPISVTLK